MCLREILEFFKPEKLIQLQPVNKRRFQRLAQALISPICIFRRRGIQLVKKVRELKILMKSDNLLVWKKIKLVKPEGGFVRSVNYGRIMQINTEEVYITGHQVCPTQQCFKVNIGTGVLQKMQDMHYGRYNHGVIVLGNNIYVAGGKNNFDDDEIRSERFDLIRKVWEKLENTNF